MESQDSAGPKEASSKKRQMVSPLQEGMAMARRGDRASARAIFRRIIHENPHQEDAWLWLAWVAEDAAKSRAYLQEAQALLPSSDRLRQAVAWAEQQGQAETKQVEQPSAWRNLARPLPRTGLTTHPSTSGEAASQTPPSATAWARPPNTKGLAHPRGQQQRPEAPVAGAHVADGLPKSLTAPRSTPEALELVARGSTRLADQVRRRLSTPHLPRLTWEDLPAVVVPIFSLLAIAVVLLFIGATLANLRNRTSPVRALVLPTPVVESAPTPVLKQRLESLWTQIDVASEHEDWEKAIAALERLRELDPQNKEARRRLSEAYVHRGVSLVTASKLGEAQEEFNRAIRLDAGNEQLQVARHHLELYLSGLEAYYAQEPQQVIESLEPLYAKNPNYRDTMAMLGQAHYDVAVARQEKGEWEKARDHLKSALTCLPNMPDAEKRLAEVEALITPPKRVVVDLSEQMMIAYQDNQPIHIFTVCTGRASAPTVPGRYEVLDKMPMAYASTWNLDMPWWIGIYWAGGSENGFHALPSRRGGGQVLWGNSLGRPCSFGCIVLDTADAKTLYDWIDVGTVVFVNF